jgi:hypothetical protein
MSLPLDGTPLRFDAAAKPWSSSKNSEFSFAAGKTEFIVIETKTSPHSRL